ncbi:MAG: ribosomal protein S18-alanine N-acetyltransferase [Lactobacillus sp.]|nr:ribosomal protein S18-alanine N-acetyltransferase [Lactobacillus sp.]
MKPIALMWKKLISFVTPPKDLDSVKGPAFLIKIGPYKLQVIPAKVKDAAQAIMLEQQIYDDLPWNEYTFRTEFAKKSALYYGLYDHGSMVGLVGLRVKNDEAHITNIMVNPNYQSQGIGHFLLDLIIDKAKLLNCSLVSLEVRKDNDRAIRLYEQYGFKKYRVRKRYYQNIGVDGITMILPIRKKKQIGRR